MILSKFLYLLSAMFGIPAGLGDLTSHSESWGLYKDVGASRLGRWAVQTARRQDRREFKIQ